MIALAAVAGTVAFGVRPAWAQTQSKGLSGLVQLIATKFNLDQSQVQAVFDQYREDQKQTVAANMEQREQDRLTKLVQEGKITEDQKQAIIKELADLRAKYNFNDLKSLSAAERKAKMKVLRDEINAWAKANGLNPSYLTRFGMGRGMGGLYKGWNK